MTQEEFNELKENCSPHGTFNLNWLSYISSEFGGVFLPMIDPSRGNSFLMHDGANIFENIPKYYEEPLESESKTEPYSMFIFTYPTGVEAEEKKSNLKVGAHDIVVFMEIDISKNITVFLELGSDFKTYLNSEFKKNSYQDFYTTSIKILNNQFKKGLHYSSLIDYVFMLLGLNLTKSVKKKLSKLQNGLSSRKCKWMNWFDAYETNSNLCFIPETREDIKDILEFAIENNLKVKAVGSGHSHSKVAQPTEGNIFIDPSGLNSNEKLPEDDWLKKEIKPLLSKDTHKLIKVKSGTTIRTLNRHILAPEKSALINQGPFDGQTISGAINTNTHGTGIEMPGFSDMVQSVEMYVIVAGEKNKHKVERWVVEPTEGISDSEEFKSRNGLESFLIQNDEVFYSVVCGYGLFGIVYSYTLEVRELYWLDEKAHGQIKGDNIKGLKGYSTEESDKKHGYRQLKWKDLKAKFKKELESYDPKEPENSSLLKNNQVKLYINTAQSINNNGIHGSVSCRIDTWNEEQPKLYQDKPSEWESEAENEYDKIWPPQKKKKPFEKVGAQIGDLFYDIDGYFKDNVPSPIITTLLNIGFFKQPGKAKSFVRDYKASACYRAIRRNADENIEYDPSSAASLYENTKLINSPATNQIATSIEVCVPISKTIYAIERIMQILADKDGSPFVNLIIPTGVRFTKKSKHYLCPAYGRDSAFIEISGFLPNTKKKSWDTLLKKYNAKFKFLFDELRKDKYLNVGDKTNKVHFHIGKANSYNSGIFEEDYTKYDSWLKIYQLFNAASVFDSPIIEKWGLPKSTANPEDLGMVMEALKS